MANTKIKNYYCVQSGSQSEDNESVKMTVYLNKWFLYNGNQNQEYEDIDAVVISKAGKDGDNEDCDAVTGCPLAKVLNCPQLVVALTTTGGTSVTNLSASSAVKTFLSEVKSTRGNKIPRCYLIGGTSVINDGFIGGAGSFTTTPLREGNLQYGIKYTKNSSYSPNVNELFYYCTEVIRIFGANRYDSAAAVAIQLDKIKEEKNYGSTTRLFFVGGDAVADGYCLGAAACALNSPLLFLLKNFDLESTYPLLNAYLNSKTGKVKKAFIGGGSQRIFIDCSKKIQNKLQLNMPNCIERISGQDRYYTSLAIAKEFKDLLGEESGVSNIIFLDSNSSKVDAPIISYIAARKKYPVILMLYGKNSSSGSNRTIVQNWTYDLTPYLLKRRPTTIYTFSEYPIAVDSSQYNTSSDASNAVYSNIGLKCFEYITRGYENHIYTQDSETGKYIITTENHAIS